MERGMTLKKFEYYSQAADGLTLEAVYSLAAKALAKNTALGVTGWLNFDGVCFFQCIEGEARVLEPLIQAIIADVRHHDVVTLAHAPIEARRFQGWSMQFSAASVPEPAGAVAASARIMAPAISDDDPGGDVDDVVTGLGIADLVSLGGHDAATPSQPIGHRIEAAGRRWQTLAFRAFVKQMTRREFASPAAVAAAIVDLALIAHRRGPAVLPNLNAFLQRRTDLTHHEIARICKTLHVAVHGRGDALAEMETLSLVTAVTAVTFAIRGLVEFQRGVLKTGEARRVLTSLCLAALERTEPVIPPVPSGKGAMAWLEALSR